MAIDKNDAEEMVKLFRIANPNGEQVSKIVDLYKKYIDPHAVNCGGCGEIGRMFNKLQEMYEGSLR